MSFQAPKEGHIPSVRTDFLEAVGASLHEYQLRFVTSWNQLTEKILIFDAGLNDHIIELLKLYVGQKAYGHVQFGDDCIYFLEKRQSLFRSGEIIFEIHQDGKHLGTCSFPLSDYKKVAAKTESELGKNYEAGIWKMVNQASIQEAKRADR